MSKLPPILILDDDADDIFILKRLLKKAEVENKVMAFEDAVAAVAYLNSEVKNPNPQFLPCVVFSDLHMPRMDGADFACWVRAQTSLQHLTLVVVSSSEEPQDRARVLAAGANQFLLKYPASSVLKKIMVGCGGDCGVS